MAQSGKLMIAEIGIDYSKADVPDRSYYSDQCEVQKARAGVSLLFGKLVPGGKHLRNQIEIVFPDEMFVKQFWTSTREMHKQLDEGPAKGRLEEIGEVEPTDKVQCFRANNVLIIIWADEVVADFYYLSPRDLHLVGAGAKAQVDLEPIVRVVMSLGLLREFFEKCKRIISALESAVVQEAINT